MQGDPRDKIPATERWLEATLFASRWLMAPFYLGLVLALAALLVVFAGELATELSHVLNMTPEGAIVMGRPVAGRQPAPDRDLLGLREFRFQAGCRRSQ
jgi:hypothetical protein